ncbi:hypothetical protein G6F32_017189 [Rhizopus arrhizus]|nr:hypothetical protein G6F32_017189 [Rhizopus arrhizus]
MVSSSTAICSWVRTSLPACGRISSTATRLARMRRLPVSLMAAPAPSSCHDSHSVQLIMDSTTTSATSELAMMRVDRRCRGEGRPSSPEMGEEDVMKIGAGGAVRLIV